MAIMNGEKPAECFVAEEKTLPQHVQDASPTWANGYVTVNAKTTVWVAILSDLVRQELDNAMRIVI